MLLQGTRYSTETVHAFIGTGHAPSLPPSLPPSLSPSFPPSLLPSLALSPSPPSHTLVNDLGVNRHGVGKSSNFADEVVDLIRSKGGTAVASYGEQLLVPHIYVYVHACVLQYVIIILCSGKFPRSFNFVDFVVERKPTKF